MLSKLILYLLCPLVVCSEADKYSSTGQGWASVLFKRMRVLAFFCVLYKKNVAFFAFFYVLYKRTRRSFALFYVLYKRTRRSFQGYIYIFIYIYISVYLYIYVYLHISIYIYNEKKNATFCVFLCSFE